MRFFRQVFLIVLLVLFFQIGLSINSAMAATTTVLLTTPSSLSGIPGSSISTTLKWQAVKTSGNYSVFVHFVDSRGNIIFQAAPIPQPSTSTWSGKVATPISTTIPSGTAVGTYKIMVGLYNSSGRLSLTAGSGVTVDNQLRYQVGSVTVTAPKTTVLRPAGR
jgi:hypothetical protein